MVMALFGALAQCSLEHVVGIDDSALIHIKLSQEEAQYPIKVVYFSNQIFIHGRPK